MSTIEYVAEINSTDNIDLKKIIKTFEKNLKKCFKLYSEQSGYEDYKINDIDILIFYTIWKYNKTNNITFNIDDILILMYSYYKIEEFYFPTNVFNFDKNVYTLILNSDIIKIINYFICL
jgi:hypothetical protein